MNFLLDTNVVSEWIKPRPNPGVIAWLAEADEDRVRALVMGQSLTRVRLRDRDLWVETMGTMDDS